MDVKWIKITTDVFDDEKILLIESLPEADAIIVIWFKLLCLAGKQNNSGVFMLNDKIAYTDKMLATIFRRKESTVKLALETFEQFGMIQTINGVISIPNWGKHQNIDKIEAKNEYQRTYMKEYREKQKLLSEGKSNCKTNSNTNSNTNGKSNCKTNVSSIDKNKNKNKIREEDIDIDTYTDKDKYSALYIDIIGFLNEVAGTKYKATTPKTRSVIRARLNEGFALDDFKTVISKKCAEWLNDAKMQQYLRPETLFGTKFEAYLNAPSKVKGNTSAPTQTNEVDLSDLFD